MLVQLRRLPVEFLLDLLPGEGKAVDGATALR